MFVKAVDDDDDDDGDDSDVDVLSWSLRLGVAVRGQSTGLLLFLVVSHARFNTHAVQQTLCVPSLRQNNNARYNLI